MEDSVSGAPVPSDTILEVETWVKLSNFPDKLLTIEAISLIASSFGSLVATDEVTYEKVENHNRPPKLRRKLHSRKTFVTICVRVSVTKPLPSCVAVGYTKGREFFIRLDFDPTPKFCLNCFCDGHFDSECCGAKVVTVESLDDDVVDVEDFVGGDLLLDEFFDNMSDEVDGEQGAGITDAAEFFEDSTVVDAMKFPAATCDVGDAIVGELEVQPLLPAPIAADGSEGAFISDGFVCSEDPPLVEVVLEVSPLCFPPASCESGAAISSDLEAVQTFSDSFDDDPLVGKELAADTLATVGESFASALLAMILADPCIVGEQLSGVFHKWRDFADVQGLFEDDSGPGIGLLGFVLQEFDCLSGIRDYIVGLHGSVIIDRAECHVFSPVVEADLAVIFHYIEQVLSVVNSPKKHHKWRDKSDVQGLFCCSYGLGPFGLDEDPSGDCKAPTGVISSIKHYLWCDILDEQGLSPFEVLDLLQFLSRLVWNSAATIHDLLFFKIHHKWRDKGC